MAVFLSFSVCSYSNMWIFILTEGPGRPGKPLSPRCPGRPTIPRWPAKPEGPVGPSRPYRSREQHKRLIKEAFWNSIFRDEWSFSETLEWCKLETYRLPIWARLSFLSRRTRCSTQSNISWSSWGTSITTHSLRAIFTSRASRASSARVTLKEEKSKKWRS